MAETMWWWPSMENRKPRAKNALPSLPRDHKTIKGDLKREASAVALREILQKMMTEAQEALAKRNEKWRRDK
jgi:hypothetical protein